MVTVKSFSALLDHSFISYFIIYEQAGWYIRDIHRVILMQLLQNVILLHVILFIPIKTFCNKESEKLHHFDLNATFKLSASDKSQNIL